VKVGATCPTAGSIWSLCPEARKTAKEIAATTAVARITRRGILTKNLLKTGTRD
jgi:hypothetical protein